MYDFQAGPTVQAYPKGSERSYALRRLASELAFEYDLFIDPELHTPAETLSWLLGIAENIPTVNNWVFNQCDVYPNLIEWVDDWDCALLRYTIEDSEGIHELIHELSERLSEHAPNCVLFGTSEHGGFLGYYINPESEFAAVLARQNLDLSDGRAIYNRVGYKGVLYV